MTEPPNLYWTINAVREGYQATAHLMLGGDRRIDLEPVTGSTPEIAKANALRMVQ